MVERWPITRRARSVPVPTGCLRYRLDGGGGIVHRVVSGLDMLISQAALRRANGGLAVDLTGAALEQGVRSRRAHRQRRNDLCSGAAPPCPQERNGSFAVAPPVPAVPEPSTGEVWARTIHGGAGAETAADVGAAAAHDSTRSSPPLPGTPSGPAQASTPRDGWR